MDLGRSPAARAGITNHLVSVGLVERADVENQQEIAALQRLLDEVKEHVLTPFEKPA